MQRVKSQLRRIISIWISVLLTLSCFVYGQTDNTEIPNYILVEDVDSVQSESLESTVSANASPFIPSKATIQDFKKQHRFKYDTEIKEPSTPNWVQRLLIKALANIIELFSSTLFRIIMIIILLILIIWVLIRLKLIERPPLQRKKLLQKGINGYEANPEDITGYDFDKLIEETIQQKEYRLAIRFYFLKNLKTLSEKGIINWDKNKTNHNYIREITNESLRKKYTHNVLIFDYVWYGEFEVNESDFNIIYKELDEFHENLISHAKH